MIWSRECLAVREINQQWCHAQVPFWVSSFIHLAERHRPLRILGDGSWAHSKHEAGRWMLSSAPGRQTYGVWKTVTSVCPFRATASCFQKLTPIFSRSQLLRPILNNCSPFPTTAVYSDRMQTVSSEYWSSLSRNIHFWWFLMVFHMFSNV